MPSNHWGLSNCQIETTIVDCRNWAFLPMTDFDRWAKATDWWISCSNFFRKPPIATLPGQLSRQARCLFPRGPGRRASRAQGVQCSDSATGLVMSAVKTLSYDLFLWMHMRRSKVVAATLSVQKFGLCKNWRMLKVWKSEKDKLNDRQWQVTSDGKWWQVIQDTDAVKQGAIPAFLGADREKRRVMMSCLDVLWSWRGDKSNIAFSKVVISLRLVCPIRMNFYFVRNSAVCWGML